MDIQDQPGFRPGFLRQHLNDWCVKNECLVDEELISEFVNKHPRVLERESWPTIRMLARRDSGMEEKE